MKKFLLMVLVAGVCFGCKGKTGPAGVSGTNGTDGTDIPANLYTVVFTSGVSPSLGYAGVALNRVDSLNPATIYQNDGNLYFANSPSGEKSVLLVKFDIAGLLPANANIKSADLEMVAKSSTSLSGVVTVGVHEIKPISMCLWNTNANWNTVDGSGMWGECNGGSPSNFALSCCYGVMGTYAIPTSFNGGTNRIGFSISTSTITDWLNGINNGLAITSENMGSDAPGSVIFPEPTNSNLNIRPTLRVNYTL